MKTGQVRFDEVKWVTVEGADGQPLDVMHVNGPTVTTQPSFGIGGEYGDISGRVGRVFSSSAANLPRAARQTA